MDKEGVSEVVERGWASRQRFSRILGRRRGEKGKQGCGVGRGKREGGGQRKEGGKEIGDREGWLRSWCSYQLVVPSCIKRFSI